ncbi:MAG: HDOD domain-containing protein [Candidatus Muirbacterium halophilum]|nr:HDOD domain-containing protein [Candidatus Muirbacterium halophilum]
MRLYNYEEIYPLSKAEIINLLDTLEYIPTLPDIVSKLLTEINKKDFSILKMSSIIEKDPAISLKVLKTANTCFYRAISSITSIDKAIMRIGNEEIKNIVIGITALNSFEKLKKEKLDLSDIWKHSLAVGYLNTIIGEVSGVKDEDLWLCGLFHNIGKIIYASLMPEVLEVILKEVQTRGLPFHSIEKELLDFNHNDVGVWLMKKWNIPIKFQQVVNNYIEPPENEFKFGHNTKIIAITHISNAIVKLSKIGNSNDIVTGINANVWNYIDKSCIDQEELLYRISNLKDEVNYLFNTFISN